MHTRCAMQVVVVSRDLLFAQVPAVVSCVDDGLLVKVVTPLNRSARQHRGVQERVLRTKRTPTGCASHR